MQRWWLTCWFAVVASSSASAQDRVTFLDRSARTPAPIVRTGTIQSEDPARLILTTSDNRRQDVPAFDVLDVQYEGEPAAELAAARTAERERKWDVAVAAYGDALKRSTPAQRLLRRHLEFKIAELRTAQADAGSPAGPAIEALRAFLRAHPDARQTLAGLDHLGRLLITSSQPVEEAYQGLTQLRAKYGVDAKDLASRCDLLRIDLLVLDVELTYAKEGAAAAAAKANERGETLAAAAKTADRAMQGELLARQAYFQALAGKLPAAQAEWERLLKSSDDPRLRAAAHLARGDYLRLTQKYRDAMWDYLWVDTVYFAEREQQAKALFHLAEVFEKLGDTPKARDARDRLHGEARLKDTRYQKWTVR